jgi:hypothetical protein
MADDPENDVEEPRQHLDERVGYRDEQLMVP